MRTFEEGVERATLSGDGTVAVTVAVDGTEEAVGELALEEWTEPLDIRAGFAYNSTPALRVLFSTAFS